jgi:teichuronic acid biosynthesis glycosyltransferase TuaC
VNAQKLKVLFVSNLFPDAGNPNRGSDNAVLLRMLAQWCDIRVIAPRPTLPLIGKKSNAVACIHDKQFAPIYPRVSYLPKIGSAVNHSLMASGLRESIERVRENFPFDVVLCSWIYPDCCAIGKLAAELNFKFVAIAQGSDIHQYLHMPTRRRVIQKYLPRAEAIITRSGPLATMLQEAGFEKRKLHVIYNGVDFRIFHPNDKTTARRALKLSESATILLFVGNFLPIKNPSLLIAAHAELCRLQPDKNIQLVMLGSGPLEADMRKQADALGHGANVLMPGRKSPTEVARYMQAADLLCMSSHNEGLPNVILEAFACGLRVVSTNVGGINEVMNDEKFGQLVKEPDPKIFAETIRNVLASPLHEEKILSHASQFSWDKGANVYMELLHETQ